MKKILYTLVTLFLFLININNVHAITYCDDTDFKRIKEIASNITINHELLRNDLNELYYKVTINGLTDELYVKEDLNNVTISKDEPYIDLNEPGNLKFKVIYTTCASTVVRKITYKVPRYNKFAYREECNGISKDELKVCDEWYDGVLTENQFLLEIEKYNKKNNDIKKDDVKENVVLTFLKNYYLYILIPLSVIIIVVIYIVIRNKRYKLD